MIENLSQKEFRATSKLLNNLNGYGFSYNRYSDAEDIFYCKTFPVYSYKSNALLFSEILVSVNTKKIKIDVYDKDKKTYAGWYSNAEYFEPMIKLINKKILKELDKYGVKEKKR